MNLYERVIEIETAARLSGATVAARRAERLRRDLTQPQGAQIPGHYDDPAEKLAASEARSERLDTMLAEIKLLTLDGGFGEDGKEWEGKPAEDIIGAIESVIARWQQDRWNASLPFKDDVLARAEELETARA